MRRKLSKLALLTLTTVGCFSLNTCRSSAPKTNLDTYSAHMIEVKDFRIIESQGDHYIIFSSKNNEDKTFAIPNLSYQTIKFYAEKDEKSKLKKIMHSKLTPQEKQKVSEQLYLLMQEADANGNQILDYGDVIMIAPEAQYQKNMLDRKRKILSEISID